MLKLPSKVLDETPMSSHPAEHTQGPLRVDSVLIWDV